MDSLDVKYLEKPKSENALISARPVLIEDYLD